MKSFKLIIFSMVLLFTVSHAYGWSKVGNGGFVIDCNGEVELFDFYEAKSIGLTFKSIPGELVVDKVNFLLNKLQALDPNRAKNYRYQYNTYWKQNSTEDKHKAIFQLDHIDVQDEDKQKDYGIGKISIPKNCVLKLALQQIAPKYADGIREGFLKVEVYNRLWDKLSKDLQASLVMHELFYREAILLRFIRDSVGIRKLNALLVSEEFNSLTASEWETHIKEIGFQPMFPNFVHKDGKNQIDLETDGGRGYGYKLWSYVNPILKGQIDFGNNKILNILSHSPIYFKGYYPEYFSLQRHETIDFTHLTDRLLKVDVPSICLFRLTHVKSKLGAGQKLISMGYDKEGRVIPGCKANISNYSHERIIAMQWVKVYLLFDKFSNVPSQMLVERDDSGFSELEIKIGNDKQHVSSFKVNLENGELFDIKLKNFVEINNQ